MPIITRSVTDMSNDYYSWSDQQRQDFRNKLALIDKTALTAPDSTIATAWSDYVQQSANYLAAGMTLSPGDILDKDVAVKSGPAAADTTSTQTTSDTTLTGKVDAAAIFKSAAQSLMGRDPTANETAQFQQLLNSQEQQNPTTANITTTTDAQGNAKNTTRTTQGGITSAGAQLLAEQMAQQNPESGAYQAATTYMNALMGLVSRTPV
jgi:hypothetical protein